MNNKLIIIINLLIGVIILLSGLELAHTSEKSSDIKIIKDKKKNKQIKINFEKEKQLYYIGFIPVYAKDKDSEEKEWQKKYRIKQAELIFSDNSSKEINFFEEQNIQYFKINKKTSFIKILIKELFPISPYMGDTPISEIVPVFKNNKDVVTTIDFNFKILPKDSKTFYALLSVQSPYVENLKSKPVNLSLLIDISGSMSGVMDLTKKAAKLVVKSLRKKDILSIVAFADEPATIVKPVVINNKSKKDIIKKLDGLYAEGGTYMLPGLIKAINLLKQNDRKKMSNKIFLLSDGGIYNINEILNIANKARKAKDIYIYTFGFGSYCDEDVLISIAKNSFGKYYFIEDPVQLFMYYKAALSEIFNAGVLSDIQVTFEQIKGAKIKKIYYYSTEKLNNTTKIHIPFLKQGEKKIILLEFEKQGKSPISIINKLKYYDGIKQHYISKIKITSLNISKNNKVLYNNNIQANTLKILAANNLSEVIKMYTQGREDFSIKKLNNILNNLQINNKKLKNEILNQYIGKLKSLLSKIKGTDYSSIEGRNLINLVKEDILITIEGY